MFFVILGAGEEGGACCASADEIKDVDDLGVGTLLQAGLEVRFARGLGGLGDGAGVFDGVGERGFAIDMFTGLERLEDDVFVQVGGGGDDDGVDVFVVENLL